MWKVNWFCFYGATLDLYGENLVAFCDESCSSSREQGNSVLWFINERTEETAWGRGWDEVRVQWLDFLHTVTSLGSIKGGISWVTELLVAFFAPWFYFPHCWLSFYLFLSFFSLSVLQNYLDRILAGHTVDYAPSAQISCPPAFRFLMSSFLSPSHLQSQCSEIYRARRTVLF
jgi:hypothetical protein